MCNPLKWAQPPLYNPHSEHHECFWGWDAQSIYRIGPIAADDFWCDDARDDLPEYVVIVIRYGPGWSSETHEVMLYGWDGT